MMPEPQTPVVAEPTQAGATLSQRVTASVDVWKRKLLDLTKRNRALNFRVNKVSTVTVVDEQPAEVFRTLYMREGAMKFLAAPDEELKDLDRGEADPLTRPPSLALALEDSEEEDESPPSMEFVPYDPSSLEEKHRD